MNEYYTGRNLIVLRRKGSYKHPNIFLYPMFLFCFFTINQFTFSVYSPSVSEPLFLYSKITKCLTIIDN